MPNNEKLTTEGGPKKKKKDKKKKNVDRGEPRDVFVPRREPPRSHNRPAHQQSVNGWHRIAYGYVPGEEDDNGY